MSGRKRIIYVMEISQGRVKIGISKNQQTLSKREAQLNQQHRFSLALRYAEQVPDASKIERQLKRDFSQSRVKLTDLNGHRSREIFRLTTQEAVAAVRRSPIRGERKVIFVSANIDVSRIPANSEGVGSIGKIHVLEADWRYQGGPQRKTYTSCGKRVIKGWRIERDVRNWQRMINDASLRSQLCKVCIGPR